MNYKGPSMYPTFLPGDGMTVIPYEGRKIRVGDVVVFTLPGRESFKVVHRVISIDSQGIRTKGDNSMTPDTEMLQEGDIIGRVVSVRRNKRDITIHGGTQGIMLARIRHAVKWSKSNTYKIIRPAYYRLLQRTPFRIPIHKLTRLVSFTYPEGKEMQLLIGPWVIGRHRSGWPRWQIRRPFRLFIDEASLPNKN